LQSTAFKILTKCAYKICQNTKQSAQNVTIHTVNWKLVIYTIILINYFKFKKKIVI